MADQKTATPGPAWQELTDYLQHQMAAVRVPGAAVGVLWQGQVLAAGFGVTNVEHPLPVTATTLFQIGSITKTFTGTLVMQLVEQGLLDLDAPVRRYLPDFRVQDAEVSARVTVRQLTCHLGGWEGDFFYDGGPGGDAVANYVAAMADLPQQSPLGRNWSYNNAGFAVLGRLIEVVTGESYEQALRTRLLDPLAMAHTFIDPLDAMTHRFVVGHSAGAAGAEVQRPWPLCRAMRSMGGLITDVHDLLRYAAYHCGDVQAKTPILSAAGIAAMQAPQVTVYGAEEWGLTWGLNRVGGEQIVWHSGGTHGQITQLALVPARHFAVTVLTNVQQGGTVTRKVVEKALALFLGVEMPQPAPQARSAAELAPYAGRYANDFNELELGVLGGRLVGQVVPKGGFPTRDMPPPPIPAPIILGVIAPDRLMVLDGPTADSKVDVVRRDDGAIGWVRFGGRLLRRVE